MFTEVPVGHVLLQTLNTMSPSKVRRTLVAVTATALSNALSQGPAPPSSAMQAQQDTPNQGVLSLPALHQVIDSASTALTYYVSWAQGF
jgi:hypothetical protein